MAPLPTINKQGLSKELNEAPAESKAFEGMQGIKTIAGDLGAE